MFYKNNRRNKNKNLIKITINRGFNRRFPK